MYTPTKMLFTAALLLLTFSTQGVASEWDSDSGSLSSQGTHESSFSEVLLYLTDVLGWTHETAYTYLSETCSTWLEEGYHRNAAPFAVVIMSLLTHSVYRQRARIYWNAYLRSLPVSTPAAAAAA